MGKVELELMEWRTEGPDKSGVCDATARPDLEQRVWGGGGGGDTVSVGPEGS